MSFVATLALLLSAQPSFARVPLPEGMEDLQWLAASAPFVFHGRVIGFLSTTNDGIEEGFATLSVDRWYKGTSRGSSVRIRFKYGKDVFLQGHDCIDLHRADSWLIFATEDASGEFEFSDDCEGGLPMSSILAPDPHGRWDHQLQQDLVAGLHDSDPALRLANIARLGGLKMASSSTALHEVITGGSDLERKWAVYAALRSGDLTVLPEAENIAMNIQGPSPRVQGDNEELDAVPHLRGAYPQPETAISLEFQHLRDKQAVPTLIRVMRGAKDGIVRDCAAQALEEIKDPRSARAAAEALSDPEPYVQYQAIVILWDLTKEPQCAVPDGNLSEIHLSTYVERCKSWWQKTGSSMPWPPLDPPTPSPSPGR